MHIELFEIIRRLVSPPSLPTNPTAITRALTFAILAMHGGTDESHLGKKDSKCKSLTPFEQICIPDVANASEYTVSIKSTHIVSKDEEDKYH